MLEMLETGSVEPLFCAVSLAVIAVLGVAALIGWVAWIIRPRAGEVRITRDDVMQDVHGDVVIGIDGGGRDDLFGVMICPPNMRRVPR